MKRLIIAGSLLALALVGCGGTPAVEEATTAPDATTTTAEVTTTLAPTTTTTQPTTTTTRATTTTTSDIGSFSNPATRTITMVYPEWEITYLGGRIDTQAVLDENMFNDPPPEGTEFVTIGIEAKYIGTASEDFWWTHNFAIVGNQGNTFEESCGVIPNDLSDQGDVYPGGVITGDECIIVPRDQIEGAKLRIAPLFADDDSAIFYRLDVTP